MYLNYLSAVPFSIVRGVSVDRFNIVWGSDSGLFFRSPVKWASGFENSLAHFFLVYPIRTKVARRARRAFKGLYIVAKSVIVWCFYLPNHGTLDILQNCQGKKEKKKVTLCLKKNIYLQSDDKKLFPSPNELHNQNSLKAVPFCVLWGGRLHPP